MPTYCVGTVALMYGSDSRHTVVTTEYHDDVGLSACRSKLEHIYRDTVMTRIYGYGLTKIDFPLPFPFVIYHPAPPMLPLLFRRSSGLAFSTSVSAASAAPTASATPVALSHARFTSIFSSAVPLSAWMQCYYRRPSPELLPGALLAALRDPSPWSGARSLVGAAFLAGVLRASARDAASARGVLSVFFAAAREEAIARGVSMTGEGSARSAFEAASDAGGEELFDTLLRSFWLAGGVGGGLHFDEILAGASAEACMNVAASPFDEWDGEGGASGGGDGGGGRPRVSRADRAALASSIFPPPEERCRASSVVSWPLPLQNMAAFEAHLRGARFALYGATRYWFARTHAMHALGAKGDVSSRASFSALSPPLAQDVTIALVDALWAHFYATGDGRRVVSRVLDVGTDYADFLEEEGTAPVETCVDVRGVLFGAAPPPLSVADSPLDLARFNASRYALWSLLVAAREHTAVGDAFAADFSELNDAAVLRPDELTAFARKRLTICHALLAAMQEAAAAASVTGIGSGNWPASYAALVGGGGGVGRPAELAADSGRAGTALLSAPGEAMGEGEDAIGGVISSVSIAMPREDGAKKLQGARVEPATTRDRRVPNHVRRESRIKGF